jgi:peptidyl-tRNA hydrolase
MPPLRLYVIVRSDLSKSQQMVQAAHAVAELTFEAARRRDKKFEKWVKEDKTMVVLRAMDEGDLQAQHDRIEAAGLIHVMFHEPDRGGEATALAIYPGTADEMAEHFGVMQLA